MCATGRGLEPRSWYPDCSRRSHGHCPGEALPPTWLAARLGEWTIYCSLVQVAGQKKRAASARISARQSLKS